MSTTEPQPDPSPAQREERLTTKPGTNCFYICSMGRRRSYIAKTCGDDEQDAADAQRLVNGWNALPLVAVAEKALADLLNMYVGLVNSGDAGNWDPETEPEIIQSRAALIAIRESKGK